MTRKRIGRHLEGGMVPEEERAARSERDALLEVLARWATGVALMAVREGARVHALTVTAFMPVSVDPPLVVVGLGPNASALPYLETGVRFTISLLAAGQQSVASRFADTFPVGPSPFPDDGAPVVPDAVAGLTCAVLEVRPAGDHHLVMGRVEDFLAGSDDPALAYYRRAYHTVG
jgi:flavin reductase (DIM6/NTAB) family NADH-FMN oxidoreductase RutF